MSSSDPITQESVRQERLQQKLTAVQSYCDRGWLLVPAYGCEGGKCECRRSSCAHQGKHPRIRQWTKRASKEPDVVRGWSKTWPNMNVAVLTGAASGVFVLDVDGPEGEASLAQLTATHGDVPKTLTTVTARGRHYYFNHPGRAVKSTAGVIGKNLDIRGEGACAMLPPSVHVKGVAYTWQNASEQIVDAPEWLIPMICEDSSVAVACADQPVLAAAVNLTAGDAIVPDGKRNDTLFRFGCKLRRDGCPLGEIEVALLTANQRHCDPPLPAAEINRMLESIGRYKVGFSVAAVAITGDDSALKWFPFDTTAFRRNHSIEAMDDIHVGWYIRLLVVCWEHGGYLPNDPRLLAKFARASDAARFHEECYLVLAEFVLTADESQLVHPALAAEYETRFMMVEKKRRGGKGRWGLLETN